MTPTKLDAVAALESMDNMDVLQSKPLTTIPDEMRPVFDYSGLDEQTVDDLHFAEKEYQHGKKLAERGLIRMGDAIAVAHDALVAQCDKHNNQHSDDTFRAWCVSIGITKDTAYRLLQVAALMDNSSPRQQKVLKELSPTLLYAVAKPSAPAELVAQVKSGDITTNKEYQAALAQIKAEKDRADAAEAREEEAWGMVSKAQDEAQTAKNDLEVALVDLNGLTEQNARLQQSYNAAQDDRIAANLQRQKAEAERDKAEARAKDAENQLAGSRQVAAAAKLRGDKLKAENDALKSQPTVAVIDKDEVERRAKELADAQVVEIRASLEKAQDSVDGRQAYDSLIMAGRSIYSVWMAVKPLIPKVSPSTREFALEQIIRPAKNIIEEAKQCL